MVRKTTVRTVLLGGLIGVFLMFPVVAHALSVTGTITAGDTGAPIGNAYVGLYYRTSDGSWSYGTYANSSGQYSFSVSPSEDATFAVLAIDRTGVYEGKASREATCAPSDVKVVNLTLNRDVLAPRVELYNSSSAYVSSVSVKSLKAVALPDDVMRWAVLSNGTDAVEIEASDYNYVYSWYWGWSSGSGVKHVGYSVNGQPWVYVNWQDATYVSWDDNRPLRIRHQLPALAEGVNSIRYRAEDLNGNKSAISSRIAIIDKTPPTTYYSLSTAASAKKFSLKATDALSGVTGTFQRVGTTGEYEYGTTVNVPSSGYRYVYFYSQDLVGNAETRKRLKVSAPAVPRTPRPSVSSVDSGRSFKVAGSVYRRVNATGYLRIYKYVDGAYKYVGKRAFRENDAGRYTVTLKLAKGSYRFRTAYGANTAAWFNPPVRSALSDRVRVY